MLKTFKAWLKGNHLKWIDDVPTLGEQQIPVHVTLLENESVIDKQARGRRMAEILEKLAGSQSLKQESRNFESCEVQNKEYR